MELSEKIRQRRLQLDLTLQEVADYINVSKPTVQRYETGEIKNLKQEVIEKLSEVLNVSPGYLMGWIDDMGNPTREYIKDRSFVTDLLTLLVKQGKIESFSDLTDTQRKMIELAINEQIEEINKGRE